MTRDIRRAGAAFLLAVGLAALLFPRALAGHGAFFHYDTWMQNLPFRAWWFGQLRAGHFATWCPGMFAGYPLFAETQTGALYPPTFPLFLLLPPTLAFSWSVILHFAGAGAGAAFLARRLGSGWTGAALAGVVYELSGFLVTHVVHFNLLIGAAWAPWALAFAWGAWGGSTRSALLLAVAVACLLLGAHPYATLMTMLLLGLALLFRTRGRPSALLRGGLALALPVLLGGALAAVQILPTREFLARTPRSGAVDWSFLTFGSFPPWHVATLAAPDVFGTPVDGSFHAGPDWSHFAETCSYLGTPTLALAAAALLLRRDLVALLLGSASALSFLLMLGKYTPVYRVLEWIPLWQSTRLPARFALPFTLSVAVLAGMGVEALVRADVGRRRRAVLVGASLLVVLAAIAGIAGADARSPDPLLVETGRAWAAKMETITQSARASGARLAIVLAAGVGALVPFALRRVPRWAPAVPLAVIGVDLLTWGSSFNPLVPPSWLMDPPPAIAALPDASPRPRIFRQGADDLWDRIPGQPRTDLLTPAWKGRESTYVSGAWALPPNCQLLYGIDSGEGFTSLPPRQWLEWMGLEDAPGAVPRPDLTDAQADLLSLDAVISTGSGIGGRGWEARSLPGDVWVSRNADPLPRVRLSGSWDTVPRREELLARIRDASYDPRVAVLLEETPPGVPSSSRGGPVDRPLPAREVGPGSWEIDVPAGAGGLVVVSESFDPDWRATGSDGEEVPVVRADGLFVAFFAPPEGGRFALRHTPASVRSGAAISGAGLLALLGLAARSRTRRLPRLPDPSPGGGRVGRGLVPVLIAAVVIAVSVAADVGGWREDRAASTLKAAASRAWTQEALAAYRASAFEPAARLLEAAGRVRPEDATVAYRLGIVERARGRPAAARAAFARALEIDPTLEAAREALREPAGQGERRAE